MQATEHFWILDKVDVSLLLPILSFERRLRNPIKILRNSKTLLRNYGVAMLLMRHRYPRTDSNDERVFTVELPVLELLECAVLPQDV